jgi:hypothetical protein
MYHRPTVPRSIGGVLDDTLQLFKAAFTRCLLAAVLAGLCSMALALYEVRHAALPSGTVTNPAAILAQWRASSAMTLSLTVLQWLLDLFFYGVLILIINGVAHGESPRSGSAFAASLRRLPATIAAALVVFVVTVVGFGIAFSPALITFTWFRDASQGDIIGAVLPLLLVCLLLLIPVIYVLSRLQLFMVPLLSESQGPLRAIGTSWRLIGGNWWRVSNVVFILGVIVYVLIVIVGGITGTVALTAGGLPTADLRGATATVLLIEVVTGGLVRIISAPLLAAMHVTLYQDLRLRKGGEGLQF